MRKGLGIGRGKGYKNLVPLDRHIHSLSAKGVKTDIKLKTPAVKMLSPKQFDKKFQSDYEDDEVGYATTKIYPDGDVKIFVKHEPENFQRSGKLLHHELAELDIWEDLVENGMNPDYAEEVAHNKNPVKIEGVADSYTLDSEGSLNAKFSWEDGGLIVDGGDSIYRGIKKINETKAREKEAMKQMYGSRLSAKYINQTDAINMSDEGILENIYYGDSDVARELMRRTKTTDVSQGIEKMKDSLGVIDARGQSK